MTATTLQIDSRPAARELVDAVRAGDMAATMARIDSMERSELVSVLILLASVVDDGNPLQPIAPVGVRQSTVRRISSVTTMAAALFEVPIGDIYSHSRYKAACKARHVVCAVASWSGIGPSEIGKVLGRDHSTVLTSIEKVEQDEYLADCAHRIMRRLDLKATS